MTLEAHTPLGLLAIMHPQSLRVFGLLGIDLRLENERPFEDACAMRGIDPSWALDQIEAAETLPDTTRPDSVEWSVLRDSLTPKAEWAPRAFI